MGNFYLRLFKLFKKYKFSYCWRFYVQESSEVLATGQVEAQTSIGPKESKFVSNLKNLSKLFKTPVLRKRILITFLAW